MLFIPGLDEIVEASASHTWCVGLLPAGGGATGFAADANVGVDIGVGFYLLVISRWVFFGAMTDVIVRAHLAADLDLRIAGLIGAFVELHRH